MAKLEITLLPDTDFTQASVKIDGGSVVYTFRFPVGARAEDVISKIENDLSGPKIFSEVEVIDNRPQPLVSVVDAEGDSIKNAIGKDVNTLLLKAQDFVESLDGSDNNIDVERMVDTVNQKVGKRVTGNADSQDCDFDILVLLPKGFLGFNANAIQLNFRASDITGNNSIAVGVYGADGAQVGSDFVLTPSAADTWETKIITAEQLATGTFSGGEMFRIRVHVVVDSADTIDLSDGVVKIA